MAIASLTLRPAAASCAGAVMQSQHAVAHLGAQHGLAIHHVDCMQRRQLHPATLYNHIYWLHGIAQRLARARQPHAGAAQVWQGAAGCQSCNRLRRQQLQRGAVPQDEALGRLCGWRARQQAGARLLRPVQELLLLLLPLQGARASWQLRQAGAGGVR